MTAHAQTRSWPCSHCNGLHEPYHATCPVQAGEHAATVEKARAKAAINVVALASGTTPEQRAQMLAWFRGGFDTLQLSRLTADENGWSRMTEAEVVKALDIARAEAAI